MTEILPILLYHSISQSAKPRFRSWVIHPQIFAAQMAFLHDHGYSPITVTHLVNAMSNTDTHLPDHPVLITFDDGYADFYTEALPILRNYNFPATLYVTTGFVGGTSRWLAAEGEGRRLMLTWDQIAEISAYGIECGSHSHTHSQLDTLSYRRAWLEITGSKMALELNTGISVKSFAYPHGYYSPAITHMVRKAGYLSACAVKNAVSGLNDDRFALARITVTSEATIEKFAGILSGRGLHLARGREPVQTKAWRLVRRAAGHLHHDHWVAMNG